MKNLLFALLFLFSQLGIAQITYQELPDNQQEIYKISHVFSDGVALAYTEYPYRFFISKDFGASWEYVHTNGHEVKRGSDIQVHYDLEGQKYMSHRNIIFFVDEDANQLVPVLEYDQYDYIEDFNFLPNGNIVVAENRYFRLYDGNFELIKEHNWWTHTAHILIGENGKYFVTNTLGASAAILSFDENLELSEPLGIPHSRNFDLIDGRIYTQWRYSDDYGFTWNFYPSVASNGSKLLAVDEDRIIIDDDGDQVLISYDSGVSFEPINVEDLSNIQSMYLHENNGISLYSILREDGEGLLSTSFDDGESFSDINLNNGREYALDVEVDDEGYVFATYNSSVHPNRYNPALEEWSEFGIESCLSSYIARVKPLANSTILGDWGCISKDHGESWAKYGNSYFDLSELSEKNEILYDLDYRLRKSCDFGITWEELTFFEYEFFPDYLDITAEGNIIEYTYHFNSHETNFHFTDGTVEEVIFDHPIGYFFTAYIGPTVYIVSRIGFMDLLFKSNSGYDNFTNVSLPLQDFSTNRMEIDYLNNLYVYDKHGLYVSKDEGETWEDISPSHPDIVEITDVELGYDLHLYISTIGTSVLKSDEPMDQPNHLEVIVFEDENENCQFDEGEETLIDGFKVTVNEKFSKVSRTAASLNFNLLYSDNSIEVEVDELLYNICDYDPQVDFTDDVQEIVKYIPISIINECPELSLSATTPLLRRCFENEYTLEVQNNGTTEATGVIMKVELDEHFEFISTNSHVLSTNGQELVLGLNHIDRNKKERVKIKFNLSCEAELGQAHYMNANIITENSCSGIELSEAFECRENIGSYDPNDKATLVNGVANIETIAEGSTVEYLIRFQNTGTDTAFTVRVEDAIIPLFDRSSLQVVAASHDFEYSYNRGVASFLFENILLPDSTTNEKQSHGFIKFKIDLEDDVKPGDFLHNTADIFFDFNMAITTNTTSNYYICKHQYITTYDTICPGESSYGFLEEGTYSDYDSKSDLGCDSAWVLYLTVLDHLDEACMPVSTDLVNESNITIYPNPSSGLFYFENQGHSVSTVSVLDVQGRKLKTLKVKENSIDLDVVPGIYFLEILSSEGWKDVQKVVVVN